MKKIILLAAVLLTTVSFGQGSPDYGGGMKFNLNPEGSKYMRFITWNQIWMRSSELNPGTMIGEERATKQED